MLGDNHPDTLISASQLALDLFGLGIYPRARDLQEETLGRRRRILGDDHPDTLTSASGLAAEDTESLDAALRELRRVAKRLLVTVPTGERELLPEQAVYEPSEWVDRFSRAGFFVFEHELYELTPDGWRSVPELTPGTRYGARGPGASAVLCAELHHGTVSERLRLALRDRRHRGEVRRVTR